MKHNAPRILVVDDEVDLCENLADILSELGCRVDVAHDGYAGLELARKTPYDVALLDLRMPGMTGLQLCRELRRIRSGTVSIIVTAYAGQADSEEAAGSGAWKVLSKPVDLPSLLRTVGEAAGLPVVLLVDDDLDLCESLRDILSDLDYRVAVAHNYAEAAARLSENEPTVVLIDMKLPEGSGEEVYELVRRVNPGARTVLVTGWRTETETVIDRIVRAGADAVCYKPFDLPGLLAEVRRLVLPGRDQGAAS